MGLIIDTSVFVALERQRRSIDDLTNEFREETLALSTVTASEMMAGIYRADSIGRRQQRQEFVQDVLANFPVIPFDMTVARTHAELWASMEGSGQRIGSLDMIIAATAINLGLGILTLNARDFSRVPGLNVVQPTL